MYINSPDMGSPALAVILVVVSLELLEFKFGDNVEDGGREDIITVDGRDGNERESRLPSSAAAFLINTLFTESSMTVLRESAPIPAPLPLPLSSRLLPTRKCLNDS